jgi:hypothetical protein
MIQPAHLPQVVLEPFDRIRGAAPEEGAQKVPGVPVGESVSDVFQWEGGTVRIVPAPDHLEDFAAQKGKPSFRKAEEPSLTALVFLYPL